MIDKINKIIEDFENKTISKQQVQAAILSLSGIINRNNCSRCGKELSTRWEQGACSFTLNLNIHSQSTKYLWGENENIGFKHPAIKKGNGYQNLIIESGTNKDYRLCMDCHEEFTKMVGNFLKNGY